MSRALAPAGAATPLRLGRPCRLLLACFLAFIVTLALAAPNYPPLSGRVVDQAGVIQASTRAGLESKLRDLEEKSGIQLVVATLASLDGHDVESYANGLFRFWKLGETKNNGVLFLVAPKERKMRIEVGYGLEGTLTDALSKIILTSAVAPKFKTGDYSAGIERGVEGIVEILSGDSAEWVKRGPPQPTLLDEVFPILFFALFVFIFVMMARSAGSRPTSYRRYRRGGPPIIILPPGGGWDAGPFGGSGGSWGGGGGFDGFSGGGGSSGGGGASGDW